MKFWVVFLRPRFTLGYCQYIHSNSTYWIVNIPLQSPEPPTPRFKEKKWRLLELGRGSSRCHVPRSSGVCSRQQTPKDLNLTLPCSPRGPRERIGSGVHLRHALNHRQHMHFSLHFTRLLLYTPLQNSVVATVPLPSQTSHKKTREKPDQPPGRSVAPVILINLPPTTTPEDRYA